MKLWNNKINYSIRHFLRHNVNGGLILMLVAVAAMVIANSPLHEWYAKIWELPVGLSIGSFNLFSHHGEPLNLHGFINDALMAVFFFLVGLEIKRELVVGELSSLKKASLPIIVAIGGMIVPVLVYFLFAHQSPESKGMAIPMATDIAFSLGILSMLGRRVPVGLKIFLTAFAVVDDIGGILVIVIGYSADISLLALLLAFLVLGAMVLCNVLNVRNKSVYILLSIAVWYLFLQSGVHATIAGVLAAFAIPYVKKGKARNRSNEQVSLLEYFEHQLEMPVNYLIMPLFAFANAGVHVLGGGEMFGTVTWAVALGLIVGKFVGLFSFTWLFTKLRIVVLPAVTNWKSIAGICMLGGVGFTVSLFIANLSFAGSHPELLDQAKVGILVGTIVSGILGFCILNKVLPHEEAVDAEL